MAEIAAKVLNGPSESSSSDSDEITDKQIAERFTKRIQRPKDDGDADEDGDYRMEELMNFSGRYGRGKILKMADNDSDSDEDRNEY